MKLQNIRTYLITALICRKADPLRHTDSRSGVSTGMNCPKCVGVQHGNEDYKHQLRNTLLIVLLFIITIRLILPTITQAHVLKTDQNIGILFHATPEDDPIIGQPSELYFDIKDTTNKFSSQGCNCTITIQKNNTIYLSQSLFRHNNQADMHSPSLEFTFPEKGIYKIIVSSTPKTADQFRPFSISYDLRVSRESSNQNIGSTQNNQNTTTNYTPFIVVSVACIIFLITVISNKKKEPK